MRFSEAYSNLLFALHRGFVDAWARMTTPLVRHPIFPQSDAVAVN